jgi:hypothetical protein
VVFVAGVVEGFDETVARCGGIEEGETVVAAEGDEVEVFAAVEAFERMAVDFCEWHFVRIERLLIGKYSYKYIRREGKSEPKEKLRAESKPAPS